MEKGSGLERWPAAYSTVSGKRHISGGQNTFYVGYIENKLQLLYKSPHLQYRAINNGN